MIKSVAKTAVAHALDDLGDARIEAVVADALVVKGRQHQHTEAALLHRVPGQRNSVRQRTTTGAGHQYAGRDSAVDQSLQQVPALAGIERIRFAGRPKNGQTVRAFGEQPTAMRGKALDVDRQVGLKRRQCRDEHAARLMVEDDGTDSW